MQVNIIMDSTIQIKYEARSNILKALAHPTRLFIVDELNARERCVNELTGMIGADTSTVSKHLSILKNAGLIYDEKRGSRVYYKLRISCITDFFQCIENVLESNMNQQIEILQACGLKCNK